MLGYWWTDAFGEFGARQKRYTRSNFPVAKNQMEFMANFSLDKLGTLQDEDRLPFDMHFAKALIAPRALITTDGLGDVWANTFGTQVTWRAAQEVFDFLGVPEKNALHFREGKHEFQAADWIAIVDFCDEMFFGKTSANNIVSFRPVQQAGTPMDDGTHERVEFLYPIEQVPGTYFTNSVQDTTMVLQALQSSDVLSVKVTDLIEYDETLEYTTEEVESDQYNKGVRFISQRGRDGTQHVVAEQTSVNGSVISTVPVEVTVTEEMTPRIYTIGTREAQYGVSTAAGGSVVGTGSMTFPVPSLSYITTRFGSGHRGIDLCAPNGTPILAADSGTVIEAGYHWSFGNYLLIDHGNGITTRYAHCSALLVGAGSTVTRGQQIATIGISGVATGYHCHFEVAVNGSLVNPAPYLGVS